MTIVGEFNQARLPGPQTLLIHGSVPSEDVWLGNDGSGNLTFSTPTGGVQLPNPSAVGNTQIVTASYAMLLTDGFVGVNTPAADVTITLPPNAPLGTTVAVSRSDFTNFYVKVIPSSAGSAGADNWAVTAVAYYISRSLETMLFRVIGTSAGTCNWMWYGGAGDTMITPILTNVPGSATQYGTLNFPMQGQRSLKYLALQGSAAMTAGSYTLNLQVNGSTMGTASAVISSGGNTVAALSLYSPGQQVTGVDSFQPLVNYLITPAGSPTGPTQLLMTATFY